MKSVKKSFDIINLISENNLGIDEISKELKVSKSSLYKYLKLLTEEGYILRNAKTNKYKLGNKFIFLSRKIINKIDLLDIAKPFLDELHNITKESIFLGQLFNNKLIYLAKKDSEHPLNFNIKIGDTETIYCTALGKAILSNLPESERINILKNSILEKKTRNTIVEIDKILEELKITRKRGYALDNSESYKGMICISIPIFSYSNKVIAAISVVSTTTRKTIEDLLLYKDILINIGKKLSEKMGSAK